MMIKSFTQSLLLLLLTFCGLLRAAPTTTEPALPTASEQMCNLPAPAFFKATSIGPTWFSLSWSPVPLAIGYRITTTDVVTGNIVDDRMEPAPVNGITIVNLISDREYKSEIWPICSNGQKSSNRSIENVRTIIIDVVVLQYPAPPPCQVEECELVLNANMCSFPWDINVPTYFRVRKADGTGPVRHFAMIPSGSNQVDLHEDDDVNNAISFEKDDPKRRFVKISCTGYSGPIAQITAHHSTLVGSGLLGRDPNGQNHQDFKIFKLITCYEGRPDSPISWENGQSQTTPSTSVVVSPNPFTDQMDVYLGVSDNPEPTMLRLYDTQGREVVAHRAPAGQEKYSLATAALPPGIYFLRVESAGQVQTVRVVKTR